MELKYPSQAMKLKSVFDLIPEIPSVGEGRYSTLSKRSGIHFEAIRRWEKGYATPSHDHNVLRIRKFLGEDVCQEVFGQTKIKRRKMSKNTLKIYKPRKPKPIPKMMVPIKYLKPADTISAKISNPEPTSTELVQYEKIKPITHVHAIGLVKCMLEINDISAADNSDGSDIMAIIDNKIHTVRVVICRENNEFDIPKTSKNAIIVGVKVSDKNIEYYRLKRYATKETIALNDKDWMRIETMNFKQALLI